jgi:hypothetical protein
MDVDIVSYKTSDISSEEWRGFVEQFNRTFSEKSTIEKKGKFYSGNPFGYSYHAFAKDDGKIIGHTSLIPTEYLMEGCERLVGISGGTFVSEKYRSDIFLFKKMYQAVVEMGEKDGMAATLGVPNENSFKYAVKILKKKHIGELDFFVLPVHVGTVLNMKYPTLVNYLSRFISILWVGCHRLVVKFWNPTEKPATYEILDSDQFLKCRFNWGYQSWQNGNTKIYYKLTEEEGKQVAYIMYAKEEAGYSMRALLLATHQIMRNHSVDMIMYVGTLNFRQSLLFKVPKKYKPKKLPFTVDLLNANLSEWSVLKIKNWKFGLIDFDVR